MQNRKSYSRIESLRRELENNEKKLNACIEHNFKLLIFDLYALFKTHILYAFIHTFAYTQIREHTNIFQHKHANTQYTLTQIPNHSNIRIHNYYNIGIHKHSCARLHEQTNTRIDGYTSTTIQKNTSTNV